jgi:hypothetical protein
VTHKPRYVVALGDSPYPVERKEWFLSRGYAERIAFGRFEVLELVDSGTLEASKPEG